MARIRNAILVVVVVVLGTAVTASAICNECETLYEDCLQKAKSIEKVYCDIQVRTQARCPALSQKKKKKSVVRFVWVA